VLHSRLSLKLSFGGLASLLLAGCRFCWTPGEASSEPAPADWVSTPVWVVTPELEDLVRSTEKCDVAISPARKSLYEDVGLAHVTGCAATGPPPASEGLVLWVGGSQVARLNAVPRFNLIQHNFKLLGLTAVAAEPLVFLWQVDWMGGVRYERDMAVLPNARRQLAGALREIARQRAKSSGARPPIFGLAHSKGAPVLAGGIAELGQEASGLFAALVFAAPDAGEQEMIDLLVHASRAAKAVVVYGSRRDGPLGVSAAAFHGARPRAGMFEPSFAVAVTRTKNLLPNVWFVDVSGAPDVDRVACAHGFYWSSAAVLRHLHSVLSGRSVETGLNKPEQGKSWWTFAQRPQPE
jgi:hypothetical protein